jgi:hypothetical protein
MHNKWELVFNSHDVNSKFNPFLNINLRMRDASFSSELARKQQDEKGGVDRDKWKEGMMKEKEKENKEEEVLR